MFKFGLRYVILELGLRCNLKCVHCASASGQPRSRELDLAAWRQVVRDLAELGCPAVDLMGGGVLLSPLLLQVGSALADAGIPWGILTNGWLLDRPRADECRAGCPEMARTATGDVWDNPLCLRQAEGLSS